MRASVFLNHVALVVALGLVRAVAAQIEPPATHPATRPLMAALEGQTTLPAAPAPRVVLEIGRGEEDWGRIALELNPEKAPLTVRNFLRYVDEGFYNGTIFHRVIPNFLIQGGGYVSLTEQKLVGTHEPVRNESRNGLKNIRYSVAMAHTIRDAHSAAAQFFINLDDNAKLDYPGSDGWGYCVFGQVVAGTEVLDRIKELKTRPNPQFPEEISQPIDPPAIKRAYREGAGPVTRPAPPEKPQPPAPGPEAPPPAPPSPPPGPPPE